MTATVTARAGESLDELVWRSTGQTSGAVEAVLAANVGIAATATALPEGTAVSIPPLPRTATAVDIVQLWD